MTSEPLTGTLAGPRVSGDRLYVLAFAVCLVAALIPIWSVTYVPMVDLPEHAYQIHVWKHHANPEYSNLYEANWFTPYLLGYGLARLFAIPFDILTALKLVVTLAVTGLALSADLLLRATRGSPWFALLAFPLAYGYSFYWGFLNFLVAAPLGIAMIALAARRAERPTRANALGLGALAVAVFFGHVLVLGICGVAATALVYGIERDLRGTIRTMLPTLAAVPVVVGWQFVTLFGPRTPKENIEWWSRITDHIQAFPYVLLGVDEDRRTRRFLLLFLPLFLLAGVWWRRRAPIVWGFAAAAAVWLAFPDALQGAFFLRDRLAVFVAVTGLAVLAEPRTAWRRRTVRTLLAVSVVAWMGFLTLRFQVFDRDARALDAIVAAMPADQPVMKVVFDPQAKYLPGKPYVFIHHPMWYHVRKAGRPSFEFARFPHLLYRFHAIPARSLDNEIDWHAENLEWVRSTHWFRYMIVRAVDPENLDLVEHLVLPGRVVARSGHWYVFAVPGGGRPQAPVTPARTAELRP